MTSSNTTPFDLSVFKENNNKCKVVLPLVTGTTRTFGAMEIWNFWNFWSFWSFQNFWSKIRELLEHNYRTFRAKLQNIIGLKIGTFGTFRTFRAKNEIIEPQLIGFFMASIVTFLKYNAL